MFRMKATCFVVALTFGVSQDSHAESNWASFQNGGNMSMDEGAFQLNEFVTWQVELRGYGQSSPIIWNQHVYVTTVEGPSKETCLVTAYELKTGDQVWQYEFENATPQESSNYVSKAAPTPVADQQGLICFFEGGNLLALTHTGEVRWQRNLVEEYGSVSSRHGLSASIEQSDDSAFVWVERSEDPYVLSIDKKSGDSHWKVPGLGTTSWASPRLVPVADGSHLVLSGIGKLAGLNPETGERLWSMDEISGNSTPTPYPLGEGKFLIGATVGRGEATSGRAARSNGVVAISEEDGIWQAKFAWQADQATSSFGSPIVHQEIAYFVNRSGVLFGLNCSDGVELFKQRISGSVWATPIGIGENVYFFAKDGTVDVLNSATRKVSQIELLPKDTGEDSAPFSGSVLYAAAWSEHGGVIRRGQNLYFVAAIKD